MMRNLILDEIKPEAGKLGQHPALVRYAFAHHDIKGGQAVGGDDQQFVAEFINVPDFSSRKELDTGQIRFQQNSLFY